MPRQQQQQQAASVNATTSNKSTTPWANFRSSSGGTSRSTKGWMLAVTVAFYVGKYTSYFEDHTVGSSRVTSTQCVMGNHNLNDNHNNSTSTVAPENKDKPKDDRNNNDDGWHSIEVFYGSISHLHAIPPPPAFRGPPPQAHQEWFGQAGQDKLVMDLFRGKRGGYFVDLAANDARTFSNTFALEQRFQWQGLCVEPNPIYWHDLSYRNCRVVAAVVGRHRMEEVQFRFHEDSVKGVLGGIVDNQFDIKAGTDKEQHPDKPPTLKYTVPLLEVFQRFQVPRIIDYLSLDVEGAEEYIMGLFPLDDYHIRVLTIERPSTNLQALLQRHRYVQLQKITKWGETLWAHQSFLEEQKQQQTQEQLQR